MKYYQNNIKISIEGKSHDPFITLICENVPAFKINHELIQNNLAKRRGLKDISTPRRESDRYEISQNNGKIVIIVYNDDVIDLPFDGLVRPGHADLVQLIKYQDINAIKGGGIASGRLTTPLVILGTIFSEYINQKGIFVKSFIEQVGDLKNEINIDDVDFNFAEDYLSHPDFSFKKQIEDEILKIKKENDSLGGTVKTFIKCPIVGLGEPFFNGFESVMAHLLFSIPAVNGVNFGDAFKNIYRGSEYNDEPYYENNIVKYRTNHSGGINGGLTNGNYIYFKTSVHPTSSIGKSQKTINYLTKENTEIKITSRNDPCIIPRITHVITAITYIALMDLLLEVK